MQLGKWPQILLRATFKNNLNGWKERRILKKKGGGGGGQ